MWQFISCLFIIPLCIFLGIMKREPRTLWSGASFLVMMISLAASSSLALLSYGNVEKLAEHGVVVGVLLVLFVIAVLCVVAFPAVLIIIFFVEGIRVIRHEGMKPANLLSLLFSVLLYGYLVVWPMIGNTKKNTLGKALYAIIGFAAVYFLFLLAMYSLSAILNLIHWKKNRHADYIVVLGAGIIGKKVTPLLAARIKRGMELLDYNSNAVLIMSGGQGPGEEIPESEAMAAYAVEQGVAAERIWTEKRSVSTEENLRFSREMMVKEEPEIIIVTTAYHVFRALILAKKQGIKCVGFGAKTKWYFTLNALIREFIGYLSLTWKKHARVIGVVSAVVLILYFIR